MNQLLIGINQPNMWNNKMAYQTSCLLVLLPKKQKTCVNYFVAGDQCWEQNDDTPTKFCHPQNWNLKKTIDDRVWKNSSWNQAPELKQTKKKTALEKTTTSQQSLHILKRRRRLLFFFLNKLWFTFQIEKKYEGSPWFTHHLSRFTTIPKQTWGSKYPEAIGVFREFLWVAHHWVWDVS